MHDCVDAGRFSMSIEPEKRIRALLAGGTPGLAAIQFTSGLVLSPSPLIPLSPKAATSPLLRGKTVYQLPKGSPLIPRWGT